MTTDISVDGGTPMTLNLQYQGNTTNNIPDIRKAIGESRLVGVLTNLGDGQHTAKVSMSPGGSAIIVDMLIYTSSTGVSADDPACKKKLKATFIGIGVILFLLEIIVAFLQLSSASGMEIGIGAQSPLISYFGNWNLAYWGPDVNVSSVQMVSWDPQAYATFSFNGTALRIKAPLWPYLVTTAVAIDGGTPQVLVLHPRPNNQNKTVTPTGDFQAFPSLQPGPHTVNVTMNPGDGQVVVDTFVCVSSPSLPSRSAFIGLSQVYNKRQRLINRFSAVAA
ncbi:unnamed protein product [Cyclocybe aegerita]|uniref:Uncharacterized protein n=1 Tax=Cyclocybe aegerita TaxID=1973307 RepID=A0A8S0X7K3_CYCAE|nr:unnamed protein product [Cyclocybe aegerita]